MVLSALFLDRLGSYLTFDDLIEIDLFRKLIFFITKLA